MDAVRLSQYGGRVNGLMVVSGGTGTACVTGLAKVVSTEGHAITVNDDELRAEFSVTFKDKETITSRYKLVLERYGHVLLGSYDLINEDGSTTNHSNIAAGYVGNT